MDNREIKIKYLKALAAGNTKEAERLKIEIENQTIYYFHTLTDGTVKECAKGQGIGLSLTFLKNLENENTNNKGN
ncbi:MAG TPA: hypothetical protein VLZ83_05480 [Edaphocola sp.]|nr:hypothetical protein [Edaphocola sp.]